MTEQESKNLCTQFIEAKKQYFSYLSQFFSLSQVGNRKAKMITMEEALKLRKLRENWDRREREWWKWIRGK